MSAQTEQISVGESQHGAELRLAVLGTGRIGRMHAELLHRSTYGATVAAVADAVPGVARSVAAELGVRASSIDDILRASDIDAVAICSSTDTHVDLIVAAAQAGKAIFCEKPISLNLADLDRALAAVDNARVPFMVGFNRRFDAGHASVRAAVQSGAVGDVHLLRITSRDPAPPPPEYIAVSGGIFLDMAIHDFDMARYVTGSDVVEVYSSGAIRIDPRIGELGDVDTAVTVLTHADDTITTIDNSRRAVYGYDQRVEAFGSAGMAVSDNPPRHAGWMRTADMTSGQPLPYFFLDRYLASYRAEWTAFTAYVCDGGPSPVDAAAGRAPVAIALAATRSLREGRAVRITEIE